jgi:hemolysin activation/secretion protein
MLALPCAANAQFANDVIEQNRAQERERLLRQQQEKGRDELRPAPPPAQAARLPTEKTCVVIHQVGLTIVTGDPSPVSEWDWVFKALDGPNRDDSPLRRCVGDAGLNLLLKRAQEALLTRGYPTTTVWLEPQNLETSQALMLTLIPGRIRAIRFAEPVSPRANAWNAVPIKPGDILRRDDKHRQVVLLTSGNVVA